MKSLIPLASTICVCLIFGCVSEQTQQTKSPKKELLASATENILAEAEIPTKTIVSDATENIEPAKEVPDWYNPEDSTLFIEHTVYHNEEVKAFESAQTWLALLEKENKWELVQP